jgi:hypothetical protein
VALEEANAVQQELNVNGQWCSKRDRIAARAIQMYGIGGDLGCVRH